jgi:hypothetical protein
MGLFDWFKAAAKSGGDKADISSVALEAGESAEVAGLNFQDAVAAHQRWKARLQASIDGTSQETLDPAVVARDDQCVLGKWLHGQGASSFGTKPVFGDLKAEHAQFHRLAGEVLAAAQGGNKDQAQQKLGSAFSQSSVKVLGLLANLFVEVHG